MKIAGKNLLFSFVYIEEDMEKIIRRKSRKIMVGKVAVGGDAPITVQSMTNSLTSDVKATVEQIKRQDINKLILRAVHSL